MLKWRWCLNIGTQTPNFAGKYWNLELITQKSHIYKTPAKFQEHNNPISGLIDYKMEVKNSGANHIWLVEGSDRTLHCCPTYTNLKPVCNSDRETSCIEGFWIVNKNATRFLKPLKHKVHQRVDQKEQGSQDPLLLLHLVMTNLLGWLESQLIVDWS